MEDIKMIQTIVIVILSIAVLFCSKCVYDLNKRVTIMQRIYDSKLYHNTRMNNITRSMVNLLNMRYNSQHKILELLNKKCEELERTKNIK